MTQPIQEKRPEGKAAEHYAEALRLEQLAGELVRDSLTADKLEEAERLRNLARQAWRKFEEASR